MASSIIISASLKPVGCNWIRILSSKFLHDKAKGAVHLFCKKSVFVEDGVAELVEH